MGEQKIELKQLVNGLHKLSQIQYNGKLNIKGEKGQSWSLYFRLGRMIWATGGIHPFRRWRRQMALYLPNINLSENYLNSEDIELEYWDYIFLTKLFQQQKIKHEQVNKIVKSIILEVLFDISQQSVFTSVICERFPSHLFDKPISFVNVDLCLKIIMQSRKAWREAGLANLSPNSAPLINRAEQLEKMLNPATYKNFVNLVNGKYTLRDLTVKMGKSELSVSRSLLPYILKGIVRLVEAPDLVLKIHHSQEKPTVTKTNTENIPLIACVDDSPQICQIIEKIIVSRGLRFISITDSAKALSILMKQKPDLIFLDLVMPVASGYEICTQLKRTSIFNKVPIIVISASESLVDTARAKAAKVMGATDFINKPILTHKVLRMIDKYLYSQPEVSQSILKTVSSK
ncbi:MAG: response regulator [Calothrix sp. MO_192.B10]|nr:response regulator [Calothrix sp. MO_192.B10]